MIYLAKLIQSISDIRIFHRTVIKSLTLVILAAFVLSSHSGQGGETPLKDRLYLGFEQRLFLSYLLLAANEPQDIQEKVEARMLKMIDRIQKNGVDEVKVESFEDFLVAWRGQWPGAHALEVDISLIEENEQIKLRNITSDNLEVQARIDRYLEAQKNFFQEKFGGIQKTTEVLDRETVRERANKVFSEQISQFDEIGTKMGQTQLKNMKGGLKRVLELVIGDYFAHLSAKSKKQILNIAYGLPLDASELEKFEAMVAGRGPQFQKLLQILAREKNISADLLEVFRKLESTVRPTPWTLVERLIESENKNYKFISVEHEPIGVGTMAQVHRGKINWSEKPTDVVIRFIKPDMMERVEEDRRILSELAPKVDSDPMLASERFPPLTPIVSDLTVSVIEEFDFKETMARQRIARERYISENKDLFKKYGRTLLSYVPDVFKPRRHNSKLMVQELVGGKKLDKAAMIVAKEIPDLKKKIVEEISRKWIQEAIFGEGFFHADLHQGNFMVDVSDLKIQLNLLDYGMAGILTREVRQGVLQLGAAVTALNGEAIAHALWNLSEADQNRIEFSKFQSKVNDEVRAIKSKAIASRSFEQWTAFAIDAGIDFPSHFVNLNRGFVILNKLLTEVGSEWDMSALARRQTLKHPFQTISAVLKTDGLTLYDLVKMSIVFVRDEIQTKSLKLKARIDAYQVKRCQRVLLGN